jgi:hypothetical protein
MSMTEATTTRPLMVVAGLSMISMGTALPSNRLEDITPFEIEDP